MGWVRDFFHPKEAYEREFNALSDLFDKQVQAGVEDKAPEYLVWNYVRYMDYDEGAYAFYDWMEGTKMAIAAGELDKSVVLSLLGLGETDGTA